MTKALIFHYLAWITLAFTIPVAAQIRIAPERTDDKALIQQLLKEDLGVRKFSFSQVIEAAYGKQVQAFAPNNPIHQEIKSAITHAVKQSIHRLNQENSPIRALRRINEASRYFEDEILSHINALENFHCEIPKNPKGHTQRSGYPDLLITHLPSSTFIYLDPKVFESTSRASSLRTFYMEPRLRTTKVHFDALHLLVGISHNGEEGQWIFAGYDLVDLSSFPVRLKAEFQASNRDLYRNVHIIESQPFPK